MDKESWRRGGDSRPDPRGETSLDELAKGLANGNISRRQALRWMGGALVGGVLASIPGVALAQEGNSACDEFCHANFSGRDAGKCTSAGAHSTGPCYTCTPGIGPGPHFTPECGPNEQFNPETCACELTCGQEDPCGGQVACGDDCFTVPQVGTGECFCHQVILCSFAQPCQGQDDCGPGFICANSCCGEPLCLPECGNCVEGTFCGTDTAAAVAAGGAPTSAGTVGRGA